MQDANDSHEAVGWFQLPTDEGGSINCGFYYDAAADPPVYLSATDMIPALAGLSTQFVGINNRGAIVGSLAVPGGLRSGIMLYRDSAAETGWSSMLLPAPANAYEFYPRNINDFGDTMGVYWRLNADGTQGVDAYAYNPGLYPETNLLEATPLNLGQAHLYSIQVSNQRRGLAVDTFTGDGWWFDFLKTSVDLVSLPQSFDVNVTGLNNQTLSN